VSEKNQQSGDLCYSLYRLLIVSIIFSNTAYPWMSACAFNGASGPWTYPVSASPLHVVPFLKTAFAKLRRAYIPFMLFSTSAIALQIGYSLNLLHSMRAVSG
jgi:hypothetical protein